MDCEWSRPVLQPSGFHPDRFETIQPRVVIHTARVQLGLSAPEKGSAPAIASSVPHLHAPAISARLRAPPTPTCVSTFLPARRCYTWASFSPFFQVSRAPSGHTLQVPAASFRPALDCMPCPRERAFLCAAAHPSSLLVVQMGIGPCLFTAGIHLQA